MATDEELRDVNTAARIAYNRSAEKFRAQGEDDAALRAVYNAGLDRAAQIAREVSRHHYNKPSKWADGEDMTFKERLAGGYVTQELTAAIEAEKGQS